MQFLRMVGVLLLGAVTAAFAVDAGGESCWVKGSDTAGDNVVLLCDGSRLLVTEDHGMSWASRPLPQSPDLRVVKFLDSRRGYVAGDKGALLATLDGGYNWQTVPLPTQENLTAIQWQGESGWITGYGGVIVHTGDGGRTWTLQNSGVSQPLEAMYFTDPDHGWAVGWVGTITRTTDGGHSWEKVEPPKGMIWSLSSVYFRDPKNGWAVGFSGEILRSRDGGVTWQTQESPVEEWLTSVVFDRGGRGWIAADTSPARQRGRRRDLAGDGTHRRPALPELASADRGLTVGDRPVRRPETVAGWCGVAPTGSPGQTSGGSQPLQDDSNNQARCPAVLALTPGARVLQHRRRSRPKQADVVEGPQVGRGDALAERR